MINIIGDSQDAYSHLSNLRSGPVIIDGVHFSTIEHAYQFAKASFYKDVNAAHKIYSAKSGYIAKIFSKKIVMDDPSFWDKIKFNVIEDIMRTHYKDIRNVNRMMLLLSTGDEVLTHKHERVKMGEWETKFPEILMKIREELKQSLDESKSNSNLQT
jgi:predicted NAD-dependent protein-ADP-ribosyltransferase YbiA (DUF1768 family)